MSVPQPGSSAKGWLRRVVATAGVVALLSVPLAVVFVQVWTSRSADYDFSNAERRGVRYLGPLTELISVVSEQQSAAVRARPADAAAVQQAIVAVDGVDRELGGKLATTERWTGLRQKVLDVTGRRFVDPTDAYGAYSELIDTAVALVRKVGDSSKLILDPELDTYYVMNATLLRVPDVIVASGRYADLAYLLVVRKETGQPERIAQLSTARAQIIEPADDLVSGLEKAFDSTRSDTLGPALLRQLDNFRTAADALAPRTTSLAAATAKLDPTIVANAQDDLQQSALQLTGPALEQLELLLGGRASAALRQLVLAVVALGLGVLVAVAAGIWLPPTRRGPPPAPPTRPAGSRHGDRRDPDSVDARDLVASSGLAVTPRRGGARAAR